MVVYEERFTDVSSDVLDAVKKYVKSGLWRTDEDVAFQLLRDLATELSNIYGVCIPKVEKRYSTHYDVGAKRIYLDKPSLVSFLHEFRHHWQYERGINVGEEDNARGWSLSVFKLALPRSFRHAKEKGIIKFVR